MRREWLEFQKSELIALRHIGILDGKLILILILILVTYLYQNKQLIIMVKEILRCAAISRKSRIRPCAVVNILGGLRLGGVRSDDMSIMTRT